MGWLVLTIVLGIIGIGATVYGWSAADRYGKLWGWGISGLAFVVWLVLTFFLSIHTVAQREAGLVYSFSGTISGKKDPGVVFLMPWQHLKTENVGIQNELFDLDASNSAVSLDQQPVFARLSVNFQVEPQNVVRLYKEVGPNWKAILLEARVLQDFKEVTAKFAAVDITKQRPELRKQTKERLTVELGRYDVRVVDVFVKNLGFSAAYSDSIQAKNQQVQKAAQARAKVDQVKAEADQVAAAADGQARATRARAQAAADAISVKGKALAAHPEILRLEAIDKLNPHAAVVFCTNGNCPAFLPAALGGK